MKRLLSTLAILALCALTSASASADSEDVVAYYLRPVEAWQVVRQTAGPDGVSEYTVFTGELDRALRVLGVCLDE